MKLTVNVEEYNRLFQAFAQNDSYILTKTRTGGTSQFTTIDVRNNQNTLARFSELLSKSAKALDDKIEVIKIQRRSLREIPSFVEDVRFKEDGGIYSACTKILLEELELAIGKCPEYVIPALAGPLREAFARPEMISLQLTEPVEKAVVKGPSISRTYKAISINAEKVAGSPEELAIAIKATRDSIGYGQKLVGKKATNAWYNGLYLIAREGKEIYKKRKGESRARRDPFDEVKRTQLYYKIIRTRLEELSGKPAYWYLLNYGNMGVDRMGVSNKGGSGMPMNPPTHFVEHALTKIRIMIAERVSERPSTAPTYRKYTEDPRYVELGELLEKLKIDSKGLKDISRQVNALKAYFNRLLGSVADRTQALRDLDKMVDVILNTKIIPHVINEKLTVQEGQIIEYKLNKFVVEVLSDKPIPARLYIITKDNVELKIRTKKLVNELKGDIEEYKKNIPGIMIEKIFEEMSAMLSEMVRRKQMEDFQRMVATKGRA